MTTTHLSTVTAVAGRYGLQAAQLQLLTDNPADGVYGIRHAKGIETHNEQKRVLKCTLESARSSSTLQGQVDWINFLADHAAPVCRALPSPRGALVEQIDVNDARLSVVCYAQAPGVRPKGVALTAEFFQRWGQVIGQLHALTTLYIPSQATWCIPAWHEGIAHCRYNIPADQICVLEKFDALVAHLHALPTDKQNFGLVHNDMQVNNLRLQQGALTVFDFDDCVQHWFISDLATALYFTLWDKPQSGQSNEAFAAFVLENLLLGYTRQRPLDAAWIEQIPIFLKLQEMWIYVAINEFNQAISYTSLTAVPPKHRALLTRYKHNIEQDVPYLESAYNPWQST
jgi:amicoumacin kinase